jgi:secernin
MCDTVIAMPPATSDGAVWFGKNSDREPGEAQVVEHLPEASHRTSERLKCTYIEIPQAARTHEILICRPFWMWGAEMGANSRGVTIGNEAVFTRIPYDKVGLTGMDLLRLALERASSAAEALDLIKQLIVIHGQGGGCGYRNRSFRYHNSFIIADAAEAYVLETAGQFWASQRARGLRTISNVLSIGADFDDISADAYEFARASGWRRSSADFDFAKCFGDPRYSMMSGGKQRASCTLSRLKSGAGGVGFDELSATLRDHAGRLPSAGWRMQSPCAHASWWPTRHDGQTSGSMISRLAKDGPMHWVTGTSAPCLSVFKPVMLGGELLDAGPVPAGQYDSESLFWRHERLHRLVLADYSRSRGLFSAEIEALESKCRVAEQYAPSESGQPATQGPDGNRPWSAYWEEHRELIPQWTERILRGYKAGGALSLFQRYWREQCRMDRLPLRGSVTATNGGGPEEVLDGEAV